MEGGMGQIIDILILVICLFFALRAFFRGFIVEIFSLLAFVAGYWGAKIFGPVLLEVISQYADVRIMTIVSYSVTYLACYLFFKILEQLLSRVIHVILLGGLNKVLGLLFGVLEGLIIVFLITRVLLAQNIVSIDFARMFSESIILDIINSLEGSAKETLGL